MDYHYGPSLNHSKGVVGYIYTGRGSRGTWRHRGRGIAADTPLAYTLVIFWCLPILILFPSFPFWFSSHSVGCVLCCILSYMAMQLCGYLSFCVVFCDLLANNTDNILISFSFLVGCVLYCILWWQSNTYLLFCVAVCILWWQNTAISYTAMTVSVSWCVFYLLCCILFRMTKQHCDLLFCVVVCILWWQGNTGKFYTVLTEFLVACILSHMTYKYTDLFLFCIRYEFCINFMFHFDPILIWSVYRTCKIATVYWKCTNLHYFTMNSTVAVIIHRMTQKGHVPLTTTHIFLSKLLEVYTTDNAEFNIIISEFNIIIFFRAPLSTPTLICTLSEDTLTKHREIKVLLETVNYHRVWPIRKLLLSAVSRMMQNYIPLTIQNYLLSTIIYVNWDDAPAKHRNKSTVWTANYHHVWPLHKPLLVSAVSRFHRLNFLQCFGP